MVYQVCLLHPFDPRGGKIGGLETYIRDYITFHPDDFSILMVGVDGTGDMELGKTVETSLRGRPFRFLPILHHSEDEMKEAATRVFQSITFRFFARLMANLPNLAQVCSDRPWSMELRRMEFAPIPFLLRIPFVQMLHGEGAPHQQMDSLLRRYWFFQHFNEWFSLRYCEHFLCVNPFITERVRAQYPMHADKVETVTTWANPVIYTPAPLRAPDGRFRIVFSGRLDKFKRPGVIFAAVEHLNARLGGIVEFHYIGASDPTRFPEYGNIKRYAVLHGNRKAEEIAALLKQMDAGILASEFEGMPRFVLETLRSGRPVVALRLPQLAQVIEDGVSGFLVDAGDDREGQVDALVRGCTSLWQLIVERRIDPFVIAEKVKDYSPEVLLGRVYELHRRLQDRSIADAATRGRPR